jgi:hypothetical protein
LVVFWECVGSGLPQSAMRSVVVVVVLVFGQRRCGVALVDDEDVVEEFAADAADEALGDRVRPWRSNWGLDHLNLRSGEDGVEHGGERGVVRSWIRNRKRLHATSRSMARLRACWVFARSGRRWCHRGVALTRAVLGERFGELPQGPSFPSGGPSPARSASVFSAVVSVRGRRCTGQAARQPRRRGSQRRRHVPSFGPLRRARRGADRRAAR